MSDTPKQFNTIDLGVTADFHVHLREGAMMELVTPTVREGGISIAYIMPNLVPPITTLDRVVEYKKKLQALAPKTTFLMTFYLSKELTPELIHEAAQKGAISGVKCYPAGVTTNSSAGVDPNDFSAFYPIFEAMEQENIVLNLHGEKPSSDKEGEEIHVLNAEESFLPALRKLHNDFPNLKIVLEHCTTKAAIDIINDINKDVTSDSDFKVAASITAHHLSLTVDSWAGNPINFCKPVAKLPQDRRALVEAATSGKPYFFFGSDSAPHPLHAKSTHIGVCAGVFSQSKAIAYLAEVFDKVGELSKLKNFVNDFGKSFYGITDDDVVCKDHCILTRKEHVIEQTIEKDGLVVALFKPGETLQFSVEWA
ncbi:Dihydroorotase [Cyberlindnera fabianii]|uniref:dihydroorotase n=1 Tax=Cyberlindnera fabianii TaxID=36022 RepID=A0A1V2L204_CYBFA|nr:Dihydroorotase [Cyberlindnera fabianii]